MANSTFNLRWIAIACIAMLFGCMLFGTVKTDVQRAFSAMEMNAAATVPAGCALMNRGASAEMQSLRSANDASFTIEIPISQPGNDWSLLASDARPSGTPTLQSQAVRLQI